jgi:tyrosyl-tRNA synthetase
MSKVIVDEKRIDEILNRGVEQIFPDRESFKKKLMSGDRIRLYAGFDATAPSLHIGNAIAINKMAQFQELGHEVIFLLGDFTSMIGDPTDKLATRKKLSREEILENAKFYKDQASAYLKFDGENPAQIRKNSEWSDKMTFKDLIEISSNFTVQQMLKRDMFKRRLVPDFKCKKCNKLSSLNEVIDGTLCTHCGHIDKYNKSDIIFKPIYLHEFLYPLAQGYDSVAMNVDLEIGGNDQMFNMLAGRTLQEKINNKEKFVMTMKILADEKGTKMGKTEGNAVFLNDSAENIYGAVMSWSDGFILPAFELATKLSTEDVQEIENQLKNENVNPRDLKMKLAFELVKIIKGENEAQQAQENFIQQFQNREIPENIEEIEISEPVKILDLLCEKLNWVNSKSEARRKIREGAIKLNEEKISDENFLIDLQIGVEKILKFGRHIIKLKK